MTLRSACVADWGVIWCGLLTASGGGCVVEAETSCCFCKHKGFWAHGFFAPRPKPRLYWPLALACVLLLLAFGAYGRVSMPALAQRGAYYGECSLSHVRGEVAYFKCDTGVLVMSDDPEIINSIQSGGV